MANENWSSIIQCPYCKYTFIDGSGNVYQIGTSKLIRFFAKCPSCDHAFELKTKIELLYQVIPLPSKE